MWYDGKWWVRAALSGRSGLLLDYLHSRDCLLLVCYHLLVLSDLSLNELRLDLFWHYWPLLLLFAASTNTYPSFLRSSLARCNC
jgi:hypothetical protein